MGEVDELGEVEEHPFAELLPELYDADPLLRGIIECCERLYMQIERRIDSLPDELYDPAAAPDEFLNFLGRLVGLHNENGLFLPDQMRVLIPVAYGIQQKKGTRQALFTMLRVYLTSLCGHPVNPVIIEYEDWRGTDMPEWLAAAYPQLYRSESDFSVLLPPEPMLQDMRERGRLELLVKLYSPATANAHVVVMAVATDLGWMNWLNVNTYL